MIVFVAIIAPILFMAILGGAISPLYIIIATLLWLFLIMPMHTVAFTKIYKDIKIVENST